MTIINQTIPLQATGGGSVSLTQQNAAWVKMNDQRLVVMYPQTNPRGRRFMIVDNPDGLNSATAPTITNGINANGDADTNVAGTDFFASLFYRLVRINAQTFAIVWKNSNAFNNVQFELFSILGTTITKISTTSYQTYGWRDTSIFGGDFNTNLMMYSTDGFRLNQTPFGVANIAENRLAISFYKEGRYLATGNDYVHYQSIICCTGTFNTTNNSFTWDTAFYGTPANQATTRTYASQTIYEYSRQIWHSPDFYEITPADSTYQYLAYRLLDRNATLTTRASGVINQQHTNTFNTVWQTQDKSQDTCYQARTRNVRAGWNSAYFYDPSGVRNDGGAIYTPPVSPAGDDTLSPYVLPINNDWFIVMDSRHFYNPATPITMKVICREDFNIMSPSTASQTQYGFTVNPPVKIQMFTGTQRPFMVGQDIMWCGKLTGDTNKFSYNVIKQPPLAN